MPALNNSQSFLFFLKLPKLSNLLTLYLNLSSGENGNQSEFHLKIITCRKLIFAEEELLAAPANDGFKSIVAVIQKEKLKNQGFLDKLKNIGLKIVAVEDTSPNTLQESLQYTSTVKMSPCWNILENILVGDPDFLTSNSQLKAIKMDIFVSSSEISLSLQPMCIKLPSMKLENYVNAEHIMHCKNMHLNEFCHVLPRFIENFSLKRARITSVSRFPGITGTFQNYDELKKHWHDMYGYVLPNASREIWYYNVSFRIPFSKSYTYPEFCVKPYGITVVPRVDPRPILSAFLKDFCKRVRNICGEKCKVVEGRASFPALELYPAAEVTQEMKPRAGTTYIMKPHVPYRNDLPSNSTASNTKELASTTLARKEPNNIAANSNLSGPNKPESQGMSIIEQKLENRSVIPCSGSSKFPNQEETTDTTQTVFKDLQPKIIPRFFAAVKKTSSGVSPEQSLSTKPKPYAPIFLSKRKAPLKTVSSQAKSASKSKGSGAMEKTESCVTEKRATPKITSFSGFKVKKKCGVDSNKNAAKNEGAKRKPKGTSSKENKSNKKVKKETKIKTVET